MGPHNAGQPISYALWLKPLKPQNRQYIVLHYGRTFGNTPKDSGKDIMTVMLEYGIPVLYSRSSMKLIPKDTNVILEGNAWAHVVYIMPSPSCQLLDIQLYINGELIETEVQGGEGKEQNDYMFLHTSGRLSIGGFGHSSIAYDSIFPNHIPYVGKMDEVYVYAKSLNVNDVYQLMNPTSSPTIAPTSNPTISNSTCQDSKTDVFIDQQYKWKPCTFLQKGTPLHTKYCTWSHIKTKCPNTCELCNPTPPTDCNDSTTSFFINKKIGKQYCTYLQEENVNKDKYCTWKHIQEKCPLTCSICGGMMDCVDGIGTVRVGGPKGFGRQTCDFFLTAEGTEFCEWAYIREYCPLSCGVC